MATLITIVGDPYPEMENFAMLPQPLIEEYWNHVCRILQDVYRLDRSKSEQAVSRYRAIVEPKAGEMTYHQDVKEVAEIVSQAIKQ